MLASVDEFIAYMGGYVPDDPAGQEVMAGILSGTQSALEAYLNRPVELVQVRELAFSGSKGYLYLSVTPVRQILSLSYGSNTAYDPGTPVMLEPVAREEIILDADAPLFDKAPFQFDPHLQMTRGGISTSRCMSNVVVNYIAGLDGRQYPAIKSAILRVAAREWGRNNVDTAGLRTGQIESTENGDHRSLGWASDELRGLQRYRRRIAL